jgi:formylglycine-generating enzyme required for sulfatase activity
MDMAGNIAEWVADYYQSYPNNSTPNPDYGTTNRVVRGGHFRSPNDQIRTTIRGYHLPTYSADDYPEGNKLRWPLIGFRCALRADRLKK